MRNLVLLFTALILGTTSTMAVVTEDKVAERNAYRYNDSFIFVEEGITFAVYPDGEFDFYIDNRIGNRRRNVTFNSGFDYSPYAQYDDYGAVIQVENIPVYYDYYGRVSQIGDININYRNGRIRRVGGMVVFYNNRGFYDYHTGYINVFNRFYTWSPWHAFFARPAVGFCLVNVNPYRRWYTPIRYTYYNPYRFNRRWSYATIGKTYRYNNVRRERANVYRNDKRVTVRENRSARSNRNTVARRESNDVRKSRAISSRNEGLARNNRTLRRNNDLRSSSNRTAVDRSKRIESRTIKRGDRGNRTVTQRSTTVRSPRKTTVTERTVKRTPQRKTVSRSTTVKRPESRAPRAVSKSPSRNRSSVSTRSSSTSRRTVAKAPSRGGSKTYNRSSNSGSRVSKAPSRSRSSVSTRSSKSSSRSSATRSGRRR